MVTRGAAIGVCVATAAAGIIAVATTTAATEGIAPTASASVSPIARSQAAAFLRTWTDDGRVVRRDQAGDTVSESQAYGLLAAVIAHDEPSFSEIWGWTRDHLQRGDGLLAWRWDDGRVVDEEPASDADLDTARALVLAGARFHRSDWTRAGIRLGDRILEDLTVVTPLGRILLPGLWAKTAPYSYNPSYASPAAFDVLGKASGDPRWTELDKGSDAVTSALLDATPLPPDWAQVGEDGSVHPLAPPQGGAVVFGYDAARLPLWYAESCSADDRALAARLLPTLDRERRPGAQLDLGGGAMADSTSPLMLAARAAAENASGRGDAGVADLAAARRLADQTHTYYGDAWSMLSTAMFPASGRSPLGGCMSEKAA